MAKEEPGIRCPRCHCRDLRDIRAPQVIKTEKKPGFVRRYRRCRHCGKVIRTREQLDVND